MYELHFRTICIVVYSISNSIPFLTSYPHGHWKYFVTYGSAFSSFGVGLSSGKRRSILLRKRRRSGLSSSSRTFQGPPQCGSGSEQPLSSFLAGQKCSAMDLLPVSLNSSLTRHLHPRICYSSYCIEKILEAADPLLPPYRQDDKSHRNSLLYRDK